MTNLLAAPIAETVVETQVGGHIIDRVSSGATTRTRRTSRCVVRTSLADRPDISAFETFAVARAPRSGSSSQARRHTHRRRLIRRSA
jgi:hypothetical protein